MIEHWLADRVRRIEASGIRRIFELARERPNPIDLSIGQPHFAPPQPVRDAARQALEGGANGYTVTQGIAALRQKLANDLARRLPGQNRSILVTSGTSGALTLALLVVVNPGDEVILFDPYFVSYPHLVTIAGGVPVILDTYPHFTIDVNRVREAISPRTKAILFSTPANPTGVVADPATLADLTALARERGILVIADEIYRVFHYDGVFRSAAEFDPNVLVVDGLGKTYGITGWRVGFAHGPGPLIDEMAKLQQFTFVCAPSFAQQAAVTALDCDMSGMVAEYQRKRDRLVSALAPDYEFVRPGGAFYLFPKAPDRSAANFVRRALERDLLIIPGSAFGRHDSHFRISYAAPDETLERGIAVLRELAR